MRPKFYLVVALLAASTQLGCASATSASLSPTDRFAALFAYKSASGTTLRWDDTVIRTGVVNNPRRLRGESADAFCEMLLQAMPHHSDTAEFELVQPVQVYIHRSWYCRFLIKRIDKRTYSIELVESSREWGEYKPYVYTKVIGDFAWVHTRQMRYVPEHSIAARWEVTSRELERLEWWRPTDTSQ